MCVVVEYSHLGGSVNRDPNQLWRVGIVCINRGLGVVDPIDSS